MNYYNIVRDDLQPYEFFDALSNVPVAYLGKIGETSNNTEMVEKLNDKIETAQFNFAQVVDATDDYADFLCNGKKFTILLKMLNNFCRQSIKRVNCWAGMIVILQTVEHTKTSRDAFLFPLPDQNMSVRISTEQLFKQIQEANKLIMFSRHSEIPSYALAEYSAYEASMTNWQVLGTNAVKYEINPERMSVDYYDEINEKEPLLRKASIVYAMTIPMSKVMIYAIKLSKNPSRDTRYIALV